MTSVCRFAILDAIFSMQRSLGGAPSAPPLNADYLCPVLDELRQGELLRGRKQQQWMT